MVPDLKTRPRTDGRDDDSACAVVNRPSYVESLTLQLSRKGAWALISKNNRVNMSDLCRVIRKRDCWSQILEKKHLLIYHSCGSFFAGVLMKIICSDSIIMCKNRQHVTFCVAVRKLNQRTSGPVNAHLTPGPGIYLHAFIHVYSPRAGADNPLGTKVDVNRKPLLLCPFVASFNTISLKYDFKHI